MKLLNRVLFVLFLAPLSAYGLTVPITVTETASVARTDAPVTYGVPFALSANITSIAAFKLSTDEAGSNNVEAQFRVLSRYNDVPGLSLIHI